MKKPNPAALILLLAFGGFAIYFLVINQIVLGVLCAFLAYVFYMNL